MASIPTFVLPPAQPAAVPSFTLPADTPGPTPDETTRFTANPVARGVRAAWAHLGAATQAYKGQVGAAAGLNDYATGRRAAAQQDLAEEQFWANPVQTFDQAQASGDYGDYVRNLVGQGLVSTAPALLGSMALRGVKGGAFVGGTAGMFPQMAGDEVLQARANPHNAGKSDADILKEATGVGLGSAAAMAYLPTTLSGKLLGAGVEGGVRGIGAAANEVARAGLEGAGLSAGSTALSQAGQSSLDPNRDTSGDNEALKEAAIAGGVGMLPFGAMGAAGELMHGNAKAAGGKALDLAQAAGSKMHDAGQQLAQTAAAHAPAAVATVQDAGRATADAAGQAVDNVGQAAGNVADAAGQAVDNVGVPAWDTLKQYVQDKDVPGMAQDAVARFKQMTQRAQTPAQEAWLAGTTVPDSVRQQGVQAIMQYNALNAPKRAKAAQMMAGELVAARQVDDGVKQRIAAMNGDFTSQRNQQFVAQAHAAYQQGVDVGGRLDAMTQAINSAIGPSHSRKANQAMGYQMNEQHDVVDHAIADALHQRLGSTVMPKEQLLQAAHAVRSLIEKQAAGDDVDLDRVAHTLNGTLGDKAKDFLKMAQSIMQQAGALDAGQDVDAPMRAALDHANKNARGFQAKVKGIISKYLNPALMPHVKTTDLGPLAERIAAYLRGDGTHGLTRDAWDAKNHDFAQDMQALFGSHADAAMHEIYAEHEKLIGTMTGRTVTGNISAANHDGRNTDDGGYQHPAFYDYETDRTEQESHTSFHLPHNSAGWEASAPAPHLEHDKARAGGYPNRTEKTIAAMQHFYPADKISRASGLDWAAAHGLDVDEAAQHVIAEQAHLDQKRAAADHLAPKLQALLHRVGAYEFLHEHTDSIRREAMHRDDGDGLTDHDLRAMRGKTDQLRDTEDGKITVFDSLGRKVPFSAMSITEHMLGKLGGRFSLKDYHGLSNEKLGDLFAHGLALILDHPRFRREPGQPVFADATGRDIKVGRDGVPRFPDNMLIDRRHGQDVRYGDIKHQVEPELKALVERQNRENQIEQDHVANTGQSLRARADAAIAAMREGRAFTKTNGDIIPAGKQAAAYRRKRLDSILEREQTPATEMLRLRLEKAESGIMAKGENWGDGRTYQGDGLEDQAPTAHDHEDIVREDGRERIFDPNFNGEVVQPRRLAERSGEQPWDPALDNRERDKDARREQYAAKREEAAAQRAREPVEADPMENRIERLQPWDKTPPDAPATGLEHPGAELDWEDVNAQQPASPHVDKLGVMEKRIYGTDPRAPETDYDRVKRELGISEDQRQYSQTGIGPTPMDKTTRARVKDYVQRVLGDAVKVLIRKDLGHTGDFSVQDGVETLRLSSLAADPMQAAFHEAFHAFASRLQADAGGRKLYDTLHKAATGDFVRGQLKKLLKGEKDALKQLQDPAEAMAYMYQFWAARDARGEPLLALGPKADGLFARVSQFFDKVRRILKGDPNSNEILSYFHSGEFQTDYANGLSDATLHHIAAYTQAARDSGSVKGLKKATEGLYKIFATADARMRDMKIPEFTQIADLFHTAVGARHKDMGYLQAKMQMGDQYLTRLNRIFDGFKKEDAAAVLEKLQNNAAGVKLNGKQQAAVTQVHALLDHLYDYMQQAGMDLHYTGTERQAYFPRVWDTDYIMQHPEDFRAMLDHYERQGKLAAGASDGIMQRLLQTNGFDDITEGENRAGYAPGMAAANERVLRMIDAADAAPFLQKDLAVTLSTYIGQAAQRAEYTRRFGAKGEVLDELMKQAKVGGATKEQLDTAQKYIMAMEGTLGNDVSMLNRKIQGGLMVYQNYRLLPLSLFSNLVDPFGIMVRGGTLRESFSALLRGFKEIGHEFGQGEPDALRHFAEDLGIIVDHSTMSSMGNLYNSQYFTGWQKRANDGLFKYNLMEGWNKSMRVGALKAAMGFIERHTQAALKKTPDETSLRYLAELNLKPADVQLDKKGRLKNLDDAHIQQALYRWVDDAIMRPNASQRPIYGSDPHYMAIFHLKQFTYTFYKQIMGRALHEAKHGNLAPAFTLLGYVPMMVAADAARGVITGLLSGGGAAPNPEQDSLWGTFEHGWERAGLNGPAQLGVDGVRAYQHGSIPFANMLGPSGEQAVGLGEDMAHNTLGHSLHRAMPGASVFDATLAAKNGDE